ncbi:AAA-ATPase [Microbacterium phage Cece]|nr:AAA-ATPase [Microbacterium phage Cece]
MSRPRVTRGAVISEGSKPRVPAVKTRLDRVFDAIRIYETLTRLYANGRNMWDNYAAYKVTVTEKDPIYSEVHTWLTGVLPEEKHRSVMVTSGALRTQNYDYPDMISEDRSSGYTPPPLKIRFNEDVTRKFVVDGHPISLKLQEPDLGEHAKISAREDMYAKIVFTARTYAGQQAVLAKLEELNAGRATTRKAVLKMVNQYGNWRTRSDLPPRTMQSVILPQDQRDRVIADLREFLDSEERYNRLAIPWHRGYMFHGPPGTGKTSLVKALANEFNLDLWYISLSDLKSESSLMTQLSEVGPRSILLLEDIDTMKITKDRDASEQGTISMSSLLNTLDGVGTPHGLITVMTTNHFELLDPAMTRSGRMDLVELIDYPSQSTVGEMFNYFFGTYPKGLDLTDTTPIAGLSTSTVAEVMKRNMDDADAAARDLLTVLDTHMATL